MPNPKMHSSARKRRGLFVSFLLHLAYLHLLLCLSRQIAFGIPKDKRDEWLLSQAIDDIKIQDMEQEEERARSRIYPCLICSDEFPISEILILDNCSHRYCQEVYFARF
jgi:hypothetical protein